MLFRSKLINENLEDFSLGSYGKIQTSLNGPKITLTWAKPYFRGKNVNKEYKITYSVYMSTKAEANMYTICGIKYGATESIASEITETAVTNRLNDPNKQHYDTLTFNVLAIIQEYDYTIAYNPVSIQLSRVPEPSFIGHLLPIIGLILLLLLGGLTIYFWRKYRAAMKELHYEMNDVRNLGNISVGREMTPESAETYFHLRSGED